MDNSPILIDIKGGAVIGLSNLPQNQLIEIHDWDDQSDVGICHRTGNRIPISNTQKTKYFQDPDTLKVALKTIITRRGKF